jgi:protein ImuB
MPHWIAIRPQPEVNATSPAAMSALVAPLADPLLALGWWALQFTPKVTLLADVVLLEVSGSERLWGGRAVLLQRIHTNNKLVALAKLAQGATSLIAFARLMCAQSAATSVVTEADDLPLSTLLAAKSHLGTLARLGCTHWGQLRALPRDGVARRFGAVLLDALDQAYGSRPEVYPWLSLPEEFEATLELPSAVDNAPALLFGARRLLGQLQLWLRLRQRGVLALELGWKMDQRRHTDSAGELVLRTAEPATDTAHLQRLLAERLQHITLAAPVLALRLRTLETQTCQGRSTSLLPDEQLVGDSWLQLLERLSARLGSDKVLQLHPCADHRPELMQAWQSASDVSKSIAIHASGNRAKSQKASKSVRTESVPTLRNFYLTSWASALYPTWLLATPLRLAVQQQRPFYQGPLILLAGPQRLESGWWLGDAALRDYFVARSADSALLWIYRERLSSAATPAQWYLHGLFA